MRHFVTTIIPVTLLVGLALAGPAAGLEDPLPSWNEGVVRSAIIDWLAAVTDPQHEDYIPVPERIAVLDNDGTSWCERPLYAPTSFQVDLARSFAAKGVVDGEAMPFKAWFVNDRAALREFGFNEAYRQMNAVFAGMPVAAYRDSAQAWIERNRHPRFQVPATDLYYLPMLELKALLESKDFQIWICTGAAQDFVRSYSEEVLGIPPHRVMGTWTQPVYEETADGTAILVRGSEQNYNGHENKPATIETRIGRRPVFAAGNSNNDYYMANQAVTGPRRGLAIWIHHDDEVREYEYGRPGKIGELCEKHPAAFEVSMKRDWGKIFAGVK